MAESVSPTAALSSEGVSIWLDDLSRERIYSDGLSTLIAERNVVGITTNPTIFANALAQGNAYDSQILARSSKPRDSSRKSTAPTRSSRFPQPLPQSHRCLPCGPRTGQRRWNRPGRDSLSRSRAKPVVQMRDSPIRCSSKNLPPSVRSNSSHSARTGNGHYGRPRASKISQSSTPRTSSNSSPPRSLTRCRKEPSKLHSDTV